MFLGGNHWKFLTFSIRSLLNKFSEKRKPFPKNWGTIFSLKVLQLKTQHFHTKVLRQKPMFRKIEWVA